MSKLTILVLNDFCELAAGGATRVAVDDAVELAQAGHRVIFFAACGVPPQDANGIEWISLRQNDILNEPKRWLAATRGLWNWSAARQLKRVLKTLPKTHTVVHLHGWSKALTGSVVFAADRAGFPVVATQHDYFIVCPNGSLYDYPARSVCTRKPMSWSCVRRNCDARSYPHKAWRVLRQWVWQHMAGIPSRLQRILPVSDFSHRILHPLLPEASRQQITTVSNLPTGLSPVDHASQPRRGVAFAGRLSSEKGADLFLAACARAGIVGQLWGDGPLLPALKAAWPNALFTGWLSRAEMQERLGRLLVLVVPSYWYETYGLIVTEAAAAGVAVIVADGGAAAELVEHGVTGYRFRSGDANDLAEKIQDLIRNPDKAERMGQTAADQYWQGLSERRVQRVRQLEAIYRAVLSS